MQSGVSSFASIGVHLTSTRRWKWSSVPLEACLNAGVSWGRHAISVGFVALLVASLGLAESRVASDANERELALIEAGKHVFIASPPVPDMPASISSESCDSLGALPHVAHSGGLSFSNFMELPDSPGTPFRLFEGSGQIGRVLDSGLSGSSAGSGIQSAAPLALLSISAAKQAGYPSGTQIDVSGVPFVLRTFDPTSRHPQGGIMVVALTEPEMVDECWFELDGASVEAARSISAELLTDGSVLLNTRSAIDDDEFRADPATEFRRRPLRFAWFVVGLIAAAPVLVAMWYSRQTPAIYRTLGSGRAFAWLITALESLFVMWLGYSFGLAGFLLTHSDSSLEGIAVGVRAVLTSAAVSTAVVGASAVVASRGSLTDQLKDR